VLGRAVEGLLVVCRRSSKIEDGLGDTRDFVMKTSLPTRVRRQSEFAFPRLDGTLGVVGVPFVCGSIAGFLGVSGNGTLAMVFANRRNGDWRRKRTLSR
jgi:hypothetical protein